MLSRVGGFVLLLVLYVLLRLVSGPRGATPLFIALRLTFPSAYLLSGDSRLYRCHGWGIEMTACNLNVVNGAV